jgi:hypothetical protein
MKAFTVVLIALFVLLAWLGFPLPHLAIGAIVLWLIARKLR